jgi:hypothetical protein
MRPSRGEGGGAAREGAVLLQGLVRCGRCGRRIQVAYSGTNGKIGRYACIRGRDWHATGEACQTLGGARLDKAVADAFLEAVAPSGIDVTAGAVGELEDQHKARLAGQRLAVERAEHEAGRAQRKFDACEPENRLVGRSLEALEEALARQQREQGKLATLEAARPAALSDRERQALVRLTGDLPRVWVASTTTNPDGKGLLRTLISEVIVTAYRDERCAAVEVHREGGAQTELRVPLRIAGKLARDPIAEDTLDLIGRLAEHLPRPADRWAPRPPRPPHRHRPAVHRSARARRSQARRDPGRRTSRRRR